MNDKQAKTYFDELTYLLDTKKIGALKRFSTYFKNFRDGRTMEQGMPVILNLVVSYADTFYKAPLKDFASMDVNLLGIFQEVEALREDKHFIELINLIKTSYKVNPKNP